ncbi:MAG: molybdenum cofactor guanylyltransferase [Candidatus Methanospirareceae archaeon]
MRRTAIILAGGKSRRFLLDKPFFIFHNKELINHVIERVSCVVDEIIVAARDEEQIKKLKGICKKDVIFVFDHFKNFGPLAGILSGLERASYPYSLIIACDMPYINEKVVEFLFSIAYKDKSYDAVVPRWENGMVEPLHAVYKSKEMLRATKEVIMRGERVILAALSLLNVEFVPVGEIRKIDPELRTFFNLNTPSDMDML